VIDIRWVILDVYRRLSILRVAEEIEIRSDNFDNHMVTSQGVSRSGMVLICGNSVDPKGECVHLSPKWRLKGRDVDLPGGDWG
jgi:hypothetical protein